MTDTFVLGAGFSKAISAAMPLADDLVREIAREDSEQAEEPDNVLLRGGPDLERWLSYLSEDQPFLNPVHNMRNRSRFFAATAQIRSYLSAAQDEAVKARPTWWLIQFAKYLHVGQRSVVTFNYDTLLERATVSALRSSLPREYERCAPAFHAARVRARIPSQWDNPRQDYPLPLIPSFRLMKLHGSLDVWWAPGDSTGETVVRDHCVDWAQVSHYGGDPDIQPAGKEVFITPPTVTKSIYYQNPVIRQIWLDAFDAMSSASRVFLVGYSLPLADTVVANLISHSLVVDNPEVQVCVVDVSPEQVVDRLAALGVERRRISTFESSTDPDVSLRRWVESLTGQEEIAIYPPDDVSSSYRSAL